MGLLARLLCALASVGFLIVGCVEVDTMTDGGPDTAPLILSVSAWDAQANQPVALEGAQLCETGTTNCAMTDDNGQVTLQLPVGQEISYTLEKEGYASYLVGVVMPLQNPSAARFVMNTDADIAAQHERVMSPYPMRGTGTILLSLGTLFAGVTFGLPDATAKQYYSDEEGNWDLDLTATTSLGSGGFVEVSAGEFQIQLGGTAHRCIPFRWGWPSDDDNSLKVPVQEGYMSFAIMQCPLPP